MESAVIRWLGPKLLGLFALMVVTTSCKYIPNPVLPLARTSSPTQPQAVTPGHWEGASPSVSFDVTEGGQIHSFMLVGSIPMGTCTITINEIEAGLTGNFEYDLGDNSPFRITGALTMPKVFEGTYKIQSCRGVGDQVSVIFNPEDKPWKAEWKGNVGQATAASSARPTTAPTATPRLVTENQTSTPPNSLRPVPTTTPSPVPTQPRPNVAPTGTAPSGIASGSWQHITTLPRQVNSFVADPANPQVVYAGTGENRSGSGVYKSEDWGRTWQNFSKGLPNEDIVALAFGRATPFTLYAMAGYQESVYASPNNAGSWTRVGSTGLTGIPWHRLVTLPGNNNTVFALSLGSYLARSVDGGRAWTPIRRGIPSDDHGVRVQTMAIDPSNPNVMYIGIGGFVGGGAGVYKSTDGGATWSAANQGMLDSRIMALAIDPKHPQTIYAGSDGGELFRTTDGAQTWEDLSDDLPFRRGQHIGIQQITVDPNAPSTIYLLCNQVGMVISSDAGATWDLLGKPPEGDSYYVHGAATVLFGDKPVILLGDERSGAWRYAAP